MRRRKLHVLALACLAAFCVTPDQVFAESEEVAAPAPDETLIYVIREKRLTAGLLGAWIAVNDQSVASVKHKRHAVIRAKAGRLTLNLAIRGYSHASIALDDRPGETVYLHWRFDDPLTEVDAKRAAKLMKKSELAEPIDAPLPNNEEIEVLINLSRLGFQLMRPASHEPEADDEHAVITIFRRDDGEDVELGVWSERSFLGTLKVNEGIRFQVPAGDHFFMAGDFGKTLLKAQVEAGKQYFAWLDYGKMTWRVGLKPVARQESDALHGWLGDVSWVEVESNSMTPRIQERVDIVTEFVRSAAQGTATGDADFYLLNSEHAY